MMGNVIVRAVPLLALVTGGLRLAAGCSAAGDRDPGGSEGVGGGGGVAAVGGAGGIGGSGGNGGSGFGGGIVGGCPSPPTNEVLQAGITPSEAAVFEATPGFAPPFVFDPPSGVVLPGGWPSPRFLVHTAAMPGVVRLELKAGELAVGYVGRPVASPLAHSDSVVQGTWWTVNAPDSFWDAVRCEAGSGTLSWRVLYAATGAQAPGGVAEGSMRLLEGAEEPDMTFWQIEDVSGGVFSIERLAVGANPSTLVSGNGGCVGCHVVSPDGKDVAYQRPGTGGSWRINVMRPMASGPVTSPALSASGAMLLSSTSLGAPTASAGAWSDATGRWLTAVALSGGATQLGRLSLVQVDAAAAAMTIGPEPVPGNATYKAALPVMAPDGGRIVYVATTGMVDGRTTENTGASFDLWQVPVTTVKDGAPTFGTPAALPFASGTPEGEIYPAFSHDGELLAYTRVGAGRGAYDEETGQIFVVTADGASAPVSIAGNLAPQNAAVYSGLGLTNAWPRFGQQTVERPEGRYYFLLFSSRRGSPQLWESRVGGSVAPGGRPLPRIYLAAVLVTPEGEVASFPAALVPGQRVDAGAHTADFTVVTSVPPPQ
ncbi:Hypothetical protein CAP_8530 [Chondromyces apiculatus DSM 436]|uniref:Uncharacterized protein n=2 Tax=Chondromyces apiculatus TaxID=51 RepID=A0A017SW51_9BACT|nr:Hypothetical protein CAP_8530 [Chondromyces apiculatus DSM 436]